MARINKRSRPPKALGAVFVWHSPTLQRRVADAGLAHRLPDRPWPICFDRPWASAVFGPNHEAPALPPLLRSPNHAFFGFLAFGARRSGAHAGADADSADHVPQANACSKTKPETANASTRIRREGHRERRQRERERGGRGDFALATYLSIAVILPIQSHSRLLSMTRQLGPFGTLESCLCGLWFPRDGRSTGAVGVGNTPPKERWKGGRHGTDFSDIIARL
ncbi:hypothetical protein LZ30DRAFT_736669 [Colletotrichum cereale]|nr:hypothetical protein LZ30DRAFT_736669 [Colletotrichum cereale]